MYYTHAVGKILCHHGVKYHIYVDDIQIYLVVDPNVPGDVQCALFKLMKCVEDIQHNVVYSCVIIFVFCTFPGKPVLCSLRKRRIIKFLFFLVVERDNSGIKI